MTKELNIALMQLQRRAEAADREFLRETFVDVGALLQLLSSRNHQVIFGRRGTGKTHALSFLAECLRSNGDVVVEVDLRRAGSIGAASNQTVATEYRVTRLLTDALGAVHNSLVDFALRSERPSEPEISPDLYLGLLDRMAEALTRINVTGTVEVEVSSSAGRSSDVSEKAGFVISTNPRLDLSATTRSTDSTHIEGRRLESGTEVMEVNFSEFAGAFEEVVAALQPRHLWVMFDEWSSLPIELQPYLADVLRRCLLPVRGVTVKLAAIEDRSAFRLHTGLGSYQGIEVGADVTADINLDDFMVFGNNNDKALEFFSELFYKHVQKSVCEGTRSLCRRDEFIQRGFQDVGAFRELVRACEGIPRDAINIAAIAAQKADARQIGTEDVKHAAIDWYHHDKEAAIRRRETRELLLALIQEVIGRRRKRTFLLRKEGISQEYRIRELYDARVLHCLRRGLSSADSPGIRYDGYAIDYGCYASFIAGLTTQLPKYWNRDVPPDRFEMLRPDVVEMEQLRRGNVRRSKESRRKNGRAF